MKKPVFLLVTLVLLFSFLPGLFAQDITELFIPEPERPPLAPEFPEDPPRQFRALSLGMSLDGLKTALIADGIFAFRGDRDVSFLPIREETLVETTGSSFIRRAHFQLTDERVYLMSFDLNTRIIDHFSVFTAFVRRYGEPVSLSPSEAVWESENTRVSIERPLTVKYLDIMVFDELVEESRLQQSREIFAREEFLGEF